MTDFDPDKLVDDQWLAQEYGISRRTWQGKRCDGTGPKYICISKRCVRYRMGDVMEWFNSLKISSTKEAPQNAN